MEIISPVTRLSNVQVADTISTQVIIDLYKNDFDVDVSRFFRGIDTVEICRCADTGFLFYYPLTISGDEGFYDDLKRQMPIKFNAPYYTETKWEHDYCLQFIAPNDKVYEIGADSGAFLAKLKKNNVANVFGSELNADSIVSAQKRGIDLEYKTIEQKAKEVTAEYDVVCAFQVLEHVADVASFLTGCLHILKPGGKLLIGVPYNNPYIFGHDKFMSLNLPPHHTGLWNKPAFENLTKFYPVTVNRIIIEKLPSGGYDFNRFFEVNKDVVYKPGKPLKGVFDFFYHKWLKLFHSMYSGKNIIAVFNKR